MQANEQPRLVSMIGGVLFGAILVATPTMVASAQGNASTRPIAVIVSGGASVPTGGFKDYNDLGVHADVSVLVRFAGQAFRLRPEFSYSRFSLKGGGPVYQLASAPGAAVSRAVSPSFTNGGGPLMTVLSGYGAGTDGASTLLGLLGNVEVPLTAGLYVIAGVGATNVKSGATTAAEDVSQTALTYNGGAGLRFRIGRIAGFVEGRLKNIAVDKGKALFSDVTTIPVSFGIVF
ncbi:MAG: hypothetical protein ABI910_17925 [Gemmatimonadota bacterium]